MAYRQYVRWIHGYLGRSIRVPLPSCVVYKTRQAFPNDKKNYVGFKLPTLS